MGEDDLVGHPARSMALHLILVFLGGTLIGSLAPELGNILAYWVGLPQVEGHFFNPFFLALGFVGIGLACAIGYRKSG